MLISWKLVNFVYIFVTIILSGNRNLQPEILRDTKKAVLESILAIFLLPQPCRIFYGELPKLCGASTLHLSQSEGLH